MDNLKFIRSIIFISSIIGILLIIFGNIKSPDNFRILSDLIQNLLIFNLILVLFMPNYRLLKISFIVGIFTMVYDFFLETIAVNLNCWYPLGGTQFPPVIIIPLEMIISFTIIGTSFSILLTFPEKIRSIDFKSLNWIKSLFKNKRIDFFWRILMVLGNAIIGTNGDYSAGSDIWIPGPFWYPIYTFIIWFVGGVIILLVFSGLEKRIKDK